MSRLFNLIEKGNLSFGIGNVFISGKNHWMIGSHKYLTSLSKNVIRNNNILNRMIAKSVRIGRRENSMDSLANIPALSQKIEAPQSYNPIIGQPSKIFIDYLKRLHEPEREQNKIELFNGRITDKYYRVKEYYINKTLESHHIVEDDIISSILKYLKERYNNKATNWDNISRELNRNEAPCVLISAELHRRYINRKIVITRQMVKTILLDLHKNTTKETFVKLNILKLLEEIKRSFIMLYNNPEMEELKDISVIICNYVINEIEDKLEIDRPLI